jgi:hypothetical protein
MPAWRAQELRRERAAAKRQKVLDIQEMERTYSQIITRTAVLRDTIAKAAIVQMTTSAPPMVFDTPGFVLYMAKTRNLSSVNPAFVFPEKYIMPPTAPDIPTIDNPNVFAYSYLFLEYKKNVYGWSRSSPPGNETRIITLLIMRATTTEVQIVNESYPIRVFSDMNVYSSGLCVSWDRFYPDTAGGAWNPKGLLNNGDGCLTTHLSDIGLFIDGRPAELFKVGSAASYYLDIIVDVGTKFGDKDKSIGQNSMAILGLLLLMGLILGLWGYIQDELVRDKIRTGIVSVMQ